MGRMAGERLGADVVVVGGGVIGCSVALRLAQAGADVLVLERGEPGQEASAAAGGILGAQMEAQDPGPMLDLGLASRRMFPALAEELRSDTGIDVRYRPCGVIELALTEDEEHALREKQAWHEGAGLRASLVSALQLGRRRFGPARVGLWLPDDGQVDSVLLTTALHLAAIKAGARFRLGALVRRLFLAAVEPRVTGVELLDATVEAKAIVICGGAWSGLVEGVPLPTGSVVPIRGQMVALSPRDIPFTEVVHIRGGYAVPRLDGRILVGSTMENVGFDKSVTAAGLLGLLSTAQQICPQLGEARVVGHWSGLRPGTSDGLPVLGKSYLDGLLFATGHFRSGILLAPVTAEIVRDLVKREAPKHELRPFSADRFTA